MKLQLFRSKGHGRIEVEELDLGESRAFAPHCDQSILHAPGECEYCDDYPDWQKYRNRSRINFTGHHDEDKAPCPSEYFRSSEKRDAWPGNVAKERHI